MPSPVYEPSTEAAKRIVSAATDCFAERGYQAASIREIAEAAGVSKANVFHHFPTKWDLYRAVVQRSEQLLARLLEGLEPGTESAERILNRFAAEHLEAMLEHKNASTLFLRQLLDATQPSDDRALIRNVLRERFAMTESAFRRLRERGELRPDLDVRVLALLLLGSNVVYLLGSQDGAEAPGPQLPDPRTFTETVVDILINGILDDERSE